MERITRRDFVKGAARGISSLLIIAGGSKVLSELGRFASPAEAAQSPKIAHVEGRSTCLNLCDVEANDCRLTYLNEAERCRSQCNGDSECLNLCDVEANDCRLTCLNEAEICRENCFESFFRLPKPKPPRLLSPSMPK